MQRCHTAQWHDGLKRSGNAGMPFRTTSIQDNSIWRTTQFNSLLPVGCLSQMDCGWIISGSRSMSQKCAPHSARYSGLPQNCNALDTRSNFRDAAMAPLCSRTGLVGPVLKGRWRLSWTNCRYGRNLGSLIRYKLEIPIKWMEAFRFSSYKESAPYTLRCEADVHYGVWQWCGNIAPLCTSKADDKRCLLLHIPGAPPSPNAQEILGGTEPHHSSAVGQAATCAPVTQRARVPSLFGTGFLGEVFSRFFLTCKTNVGKI